MIPSSAHAKLMHRSEVTLQDAVVAVTVVECSMQVLQVWNTARVLITLFPAIGMRPAGWRRTGSYFSPTFVTKVFLLNWLGSPIVCDYACLHLCLLFTDTCHGLMQGAALLGGINVLHSAFPADADVEYHTQGKHCIAPFDWALVKGLVL